MNFWRNFRIARISGIDIEANPSWLIIFGLVAFTLSASIFPNRYPGWSEATYWAVGTAAALLLFVTVLVHELAHAFVARTRGISVPRITLFIFGGVSHMQSQPKTARAEFQIAAAGPATSFIIAIVMGAAALALNGLNEQTTATLAYLATVNVLLGAFNMVPGFPLDGGRVLRSIIWARTHNFRRATTVASNGGQLVGFGIMALGVVFFLAGGIISGIWFFIIGWFLRGAAQAEGQGSRLDELLGKLRARDLMQADVETVEPDEVLRHVVDEHLLARGARAVMVSRNGGPLGILTVTDLRHVPRSEWDRTLASQAMTPRERLKVVQAGNSARDVLRLIQEEGLNQVPVLDDSRVVGMVSRRELIERLQLQESLGSTG